MRAVVKDHKRRPAKANVPRMVGGYASRRKAMNGGQYHEYYLPTIFGENLMDVFDDFDRDFFRGFGQHRPRPVRQTAQRMMKTDVKETDEGYEVDVELPGFKKDEIQLELNNGYLTITAEKGLDKENKKGRMLRQERYAGVMQRSFYVGEHVTEENVKASTRAAFCTCWCRNRKHRSCPRKRLSRLRAEPRAPQERSRGAHPFCEDPCEGFPLRARKCSPRALFVPIPI